MQGVISDLWPHMQGGRKEASFQAGDQVGTSDHPREEMRSWMEEDWKWKMAPLRGAQCKSQAHYA